MKTEEISAEYSEKLVPLTVDEIASLKKRRVKTALGIMAFSVFWYGVLYFIISNAHDDVFKIFGALFAVMPLVILGMALFSATRDIQFAQKKVIRGRLDSKREETRTTGTSKNRSSRTYYYFYLAGKEMTVNSKNYHEFQTGDIVEIEQMPKSGDIIKIRELQSNRVQDAAKKPVFASDRGPLFVQAPERFDSAPLSVEEESFLKSLRNKRAVWTVVLCGVIGYFVHAFLILFFGLAILPFLIQSGTSYSLAGPILYWVITIGIVATAGLIIYKRVGLLQQDISEGRKNIFKRIIDDKQRSNVKIVSKNVRITSTRGDFYYIVIDGKYYDVSPEQFLKLECGNPVKMHISPHSGTLLKIE